MNRFSDLLEALKGRLGDDAFKELLESVDKMDVSSAPEKEPAVRLPYSSDPIPLGEPWAN
ncbi:MAG: hypothetical protein JSR55_16080 [Proteobacteria bacterium]|nr:hypothetical protein [Pseudomonadota bacterium]